MRQYFTFVAIILACACSSPKQNQPDPSPAAIPDALQEDRKSSGYSKRAPENLVEELYAEKLSSDTALQSLEKTFEILQTLKPDSLEAFNFFHTKNEAYYRSALDFTSRIHDSLLKKETAAYFTNASAGYKNRVSGLTALSNTIDDKELSLRDRFHILKLFVSLSMMNQFQQHNFPAVKPLEEIIKKQDRLISSLDSAIAKNK
jgi:hypothetical protein